MVWSYTPYMFLALLASLFSLSLTWVAWRRRPFQGAGAFIGLMLSAGWWALGYALELVGDTLALKAYWGRLEYVGIAFVPVFWLLFVQAYTGSRRGLYLLYKVALFVMAGITSVLALTDAYHHLIWRSVVLNSKGHLAVLDVVEYGPWFWVHTAVSYVLILAGIFLMLRFLWRSRAMYRQQALILSLGSLLPLVGNLMYLSGASPGGVDLTPLLFPVSGGLLAWGAFRYRLLDVVPVVRWAVVESIGDAVIALDLRDRIIDVNPAAQRLFQRPEWELLGRAFDQVFPNTFSLAAYPDTLRVIHDELQLTFGILPRAYEFHLFPLFDHQARHRGRLVVLRDITERKRLEASLEAQMHRLHALVQSSRDGVALLGMDLQLLVVNQPALSCLGLRGSPEDWLNRSLWDVLSALREFAPDVVRTVLREMRRVRAGNEPHEEGEYRIGTRTIQWSNLPVIGESTKPLGRLIVVRDVTQDRLLEQMRADLTHTMVHDLRNPLTGIYGALQLLRPRIETRLSDPEMDVWRIAENSTQRMLGLVNAILDISRLESGRMPLNPTVFSFDDVLDSTLELQKPLAAQRELELAGECRTDQCFVRADEELITRVLQNLVDNALKFTPAGGAVQLFTQVKSDLPDKLCVSVKDTGPGIPAEIQEHLFEKFVTGPQDNRGNGLGLAFCHMVLKAHHERIWVDSVPGQGTTFTFTLPVVLK